MNMNAINPNFLEEAGEYLQANGFQRIDSSVGNMIRFQKKDLTVMVLGDAIDVLVAHDEEPGQRKAELSLVHSHIGISQLRTVLDYMFLFHITGVVPLRQFIKAAKAQMKEVPFFPDLENYFRIAENHNAIPINY